MIRSLYVRVVLTFLAAVIIGMAIAYAFTWIVFQHQIAREVHDETISVSDDLIDIYAHSPDPDAKSLRNQLRALRNYSIRIMDRGGDVLVLDAKYATGPIPITAREASRVLSGETVVSRTRQPEYVGRPFERNGAAYALFVMPVFSSDVSLARLLAVFLAILFGVGSLLFLGASRYLVRPIRKMTSATERMARGDFGATLNLSRKDELGTLARSFDYMGRELRQIERMRRDFVSNVSHEIQSPLTSIAGFAQALRDGVASDENRTLYLDIIAAESERLSRLSGNLLRLASLESEHHPFEPASFPLDEQIRRAVVALEPHWSRKRIAIEPDLQAVRIFADADQLNQVWTNLLGNAIKFTPEGGTVRIGLRAVPRGIEATIADTGIGISPDQLAYIFERFYKADRSRNRSHQGSGLGLAIAKKIVELHEGRIEVSSVPGEGTVFRVFLPAGRPHEAAG